MWSSWCRWNNNTKDRSVEVNGTVIKTSVGTVDSVKIARVTNIVNTINYLKKKGFWITGTDMKGTNYKKIDYKGKMAIVIGNEGNGLTDSVAERASRKIRIPMQGKTESLNAAVSATVVLFETERQRLIAAGENM